jgi:hypothetical protein
MGELSRFSADQEAMRKAAEGWNRTDRDASLRRSAEFIETMQERKVGQVALYFETSTTRPRKRGQSFLNVTYDYTEHGSGWPLTDSSDDTPTYYIVTESNDTYKCRGSESTPAIRAAARKRRTFGRGPFVVTDAPIVDGELSPQLEYPFKDPYGLGILDSAIRHYEQQAHDLRDE